MRGIRRRAVVAAIGLSTLVACASAGAAGDGGGVAHYVNGIRTVYVTIHYSHFSLDHMAFARGTTVRFVIHNTDPIDHEFIVGDKAVQDYIENTAHPDHDGSVPGQISVPPGATRTTTYTFSRVEPLQFACHVRGHYAYGMHGSITVTA